MSAPGASLRHAPAEATHRLPPSGSLLRLLHRSFTRGGTYYITASGLEGDLERLESDMAVLLKLGVLCSGQGARGEVSWPVLAAAWSRGKEGVRARPPGGGTS